jgi:hypothetical protein
MNRSTLIRVLIAALFATLAACGSPQTKGSAVQDDSDSNRLASALPKIALVSVQREAFEALDIGQEAIDAGAQVLLFPEWGFYPQPDVADLVLNKWKMLADTHDVYIAMGARYQERNALFVFTPDGQRLISFRRDGHNSAPPTGPFDNKPLVVDSAFGRLGFLICDESRSKKFLDEIRGYSIDYLLVPNWVGAFAQKEDIQQRSQELGYWTDVYSTDIAGEYGNRTHVFRHADSTVEFNAFGAAAPFSAPGATKIHPSGLRYVISYHDLRK